MRRAALAVICLLLAACGSVKQPSSSTGFVGDKRNLITYDEIKATRTPGWTAWDLIAQIRPNFLRARGATSSDDPTPARPVVYLDGMLYGKLELLHGLNVEDIREIEFISAPDATIRFGTGHLGGAILVRTR